VDVAALSRLTSGFSTGGQGRGILDSHGISVGGGAIVAPAASELRPLGWDMMPMATWWMSFSHFSQRFMFTVGCSVSGVERGLPGGSMVPLTEEERSGRDSGPEMAGNAAVCVPMVA
jgi:hypothetical protein